MPSNAHPPGPPASFRMPRPGLIIISTVLLAWDPGQVDSEPLPGIQGLLDHLFSEGTPCVLVTNGGRQQVAGLLDAIGCAGRLPLRICGEDMTAPIPDPGAFQLAASRLALPTSRCLVIADGPDGIRAGCRAGCTTVGLTGRAGDQAMLAAGAQQLVARLDAMTPLSDWIERHISYGEVPRSALLMAKAAG